MEKRPQADDSTAQENYVFNNVSSISLSTLRLVHTLALMIVGLGSRIPCIFLNAGITKRLQVTTADTGLPEKKRGSKKQRERVMKK